MLKMSNYSLPNGSTDWAAYKRAKVNAGEECMTCGAFMLNLAELSGPRECSSCRQLRTTEVTRHPDRIRCPHCRHTFSATMYASENAIYRIYEEGEHEITCPECDRDFVFTTSVSYAFTSPEVKEQHESECSVECNDSAH